MVLMERKMHGHLQRRERRELGQMTSRGLDTLMDEASMSSPSATYSKQSPDIIYKYRHGRVRTDRSTAR
jgi:hypothetical protein